MPISLGQNKPEYEIAKIIEPSSEVLPISRPYISSFYFTHVSIKIMMSSSEVSMRKGTHELSDSSHPLLLSSCPFLPLLGPQTSLRLKNMSYLSSLY